jgi:RNA polymerase sigma-70 factor (ECF subfamily)
MSPLESTVSKPTAVELPLVQRAGAVHLLTARSTCTSAQDQAPEAWSEPTLLQHLLAHDKHAWREFVRRYKPLILSVIRTVTRRFSGALGSTDCEEIYASLLCSLFSRDMHCLRAFDTRRGVRLSTWVGLLARNAVWDYLRAQSRRGQIDEHFDVDVVQGDGPAPDLALHGKELWGRMVATLAALSERDQRFVQLYYVERLDPIQVSRQMNISVKTVYSKKNKLRATLSAVFADHA